MTITESVREQVESGRKGLNQGLSTGIDKLDQLTGGVLKGRYIVITSNPGGGKYIIILDFGFEKIKNIFVPVFQIILV